MHALTTGVARGGLFQDAQKHIFNEKCPIYFVIFLTQNTVSEAYNGHSGFRSAPQECSLQDKFLATVKQAESSGLMSHC